MDKRDILFAGFSVFLFILIVLALYKESNPEWPERSIDWRDYQREYYKKLAAKLNDKEIAKTPLKIQQIWNKELNRADRCMTCHMGINKSIFSDEEHPYKSHPDLDGYISKHPFEKFGCTICHQGDGQTVKYTQTHGHVEHLDWQPLEGVYLQSSCTKCHIEMFAENVYFPEAPVLMKGKSL
ncbi:MAG: cytochrome c, class I, partial [Nitrospirota bacterium]